MRPIDMVNIPEKLANELLRLYKLNPHWVCYEDLGEEQYRAIATEDTWVNKLWLSGGDAFGMKALSWWLGQGPKIFKPSQAQAQALEQVDVNLPLGDYTQPYPAMLVMLGKDWYPPFESVLLFHDRGALSGSRDTLSGTIHSEGHEYDITTTVRCDGRPIEVSLRKFDEDCSDHNETAAKVLRIACNSCLALSHFGCHLDYLFPKELQRDRHYAQENNERGKRARQRVSLAVQVASFDQEVVLHRVERSDDREDSVPTGRTMPTHWRRGHWAMQAHGPSHSLRKRIFRQPVMIHKDLFIGDASTVLTTYKTTTRS
jgi:hypothetical protein